MTTCRSPRLLPSAFDRAAPATRERPQHARRRASVRSLADRSHRQPPDPASQGCSSNRDLRGQCRLGTNQARAAHEGRELRRMKRAGVCPNGPRNPLLANPGGRRQPRISVAARSRRERCQPPATRRDWLRNHGEVAPIACGPDLGAAVTRASSSHRQRCATCLERATRPRPLTRRRLAR
jgi:hypothetical protein